MKADHNSDEYQVALLIDDISEAKRISDALREMGIFAHYYQDLDEMWVSLNAYTPGFCIVDVKKMSSGNLLFKDHPKVKNHQLKLAFYYNESVKPLLSSTYGIQHYGLIRADLDIGEQLKIVFQLKDQEQNLTAQVNDLNQRVVRLKAHGNRVAEKQEALHYKVEQLEALNELMRKFGVVSNQQDFYQRVIHIFSNWESCLEFGMYYLNSSKQKLVSPKERKLNYKQLPDLWLSEANKDGIEHYAAEMANDVCYNEIDGDLINIRVEGINKGPDILVWGKFDKKTTKFFQWDILEQKLNSEYRKVILKQMETSTASTNLGIHQLLYEMDEIQFHKADSKYRYALLDFSKLMGMVRQRAKLRFNWKQFGMDLTAEIANVLDKSDYKITVAAPGHFIVGLDRANLEQNFNKLKVYIESVESWRYFNDHSLLMNFDTSASVKLISPSSVNVVRQLEDGYIDIMEKPVTILERSRPTPSV